MSAALQFTSACFASIVLHAHLRDLTDIVVLSLLVTVFSLWFHCTKDHTVVLFDFAAAYTYFFYTAFQLWRRRSKVLWLSFVLVVTNWYLCDACDPDEQLFLHVLMHAQVLVGSHVYVATMGKQTVQHKWSTPMREKPYLL